jgi:membrane-bound lytic murein transglycosylase D
MPTTARAYGLRVNARDDDWLHVERSTRAAARRLRDLYLQFGSWDLALAAYNYGSGGVQRAMERAATSDFQELVAARVLPSETLAYVPAVFHAARLLNVVGWEKAPAAPNGSPKTTNVMFARARR